ncbi:hypothetical protein HPB48_008178 [Haemaphysalis longicornis]|uniref:Cytochrome P450 n=1 Tax=Haemaphysalis longicornis TaxID=44386 RepID=A0A9J6H2N4_HAELO|nr:hypothetical protein HPB48_008178 [Haemaphysalis longicornis]
MPFCYMRSDEMLRRLKQLAWPTLSDRAEAQVDIHMCEVERAMVFFQQLRSASLRQIPVFANSLVTCRLEKYFPQPERFHPERWLGEARCRIHPFSMLPFGHGARMCVGRRFSELELMTAAAKMVENFIIEPCTQHINTSYVFVVVPSHPVALRFRDRK